MPPPVRRLRKDEQGVASTVATVLSILLFLTFLSVVANSYVPVWTMDSEAAHMKVALGQFGEIKDAVNLQAMAIQLARQRNVPFVSSTVSSPASLGIAGVPIFSSPTSGTLTIDPSATTGSVDFTYLILGVTQAVHETASGAIELNVGNRVFVPGQVVYENGAVIRSQVDGQTIITPPVFEVQVTHNALRLILQLVSIYGSGTASGFTTEIVATKVYAYDQQVYTNFSSKLELHEVTPFGLAWFNYLNASMAAAVHLPGTYHYTPGLEISFEVSSGGTHVYEVEAEYIPQTALWQIELEIYNTAALPLDSVTLGHAYVEAGIGGEPASSGP